MALDHSFVSDNYAGIHPDVLAAISDTNTGHDKAYGADDATSRLATIIRDMFGANAHAFPVFSGTGANVVALQAYSHTWDAVICANTAHIHGMEGGAPEKVAGLKLWTAPAPDGRINVNDFDAQMYRIGDLHRAQPSLLSLTQCTELGTVYSISDIATLVDRAHHHGLKVHMDGARLANAAAHLGVTLPTISTDLGVDVLTLGGTKNGALGAELVIVNDDDHARIFPYVLKGSMQMPSKTRFVSAQMEALLTDDLWRRNATHANAMARRLEEGIQSIPGVNILWPVESNVVFASIPMDAARDLQQQFPFYIQDEAPHACRWMTSWDTTEGDVDTFVAAIRAALAD